MIEQFRVLDGHECLGEILKIRRIGEETTQTNDFEVEKEACN